MRVSLAVELVETEQIENAEKFVKMAVALDPAVKLVVRDCKRIEARQTMRSSKWLGAIDRSQEEIGLCESWMLNPV